MAKKITCPNCGHSWDKSTSTAKDAHVCHICGKGNVNMKDGGWLDKYDVPEAQNGIEGTMGGLTDKGFNYNGAWGGPSMQDGGDIGTRPEDLDIKAIDAWEKAYTNSPRFAELSKKQGDSRKMTQKRRDVVNQFDINKDIIRIPEGVPHVEDGKFYLSSDIGDWPNYSDVNAHEFGHLPYSTGDMNFPKKTFKEIQSRNKEFIKSKKTGKIDENIEHDIAPNEVRADKNQLLFQLQKLGIYNATKDGDIKQEQLDKFKESGEWNRLQRLYDDKDILWLINNVAMNPSKSSSNFMAMGGSLPGTVGFTYARTGSIPSNGPYAKKTKASAQNGKAVSDNTSVNKPRTDMLTMDEYRVQKAKQSTVTKAEPKRSTASKALAIASNPMTALSYKVKGQDIPENFERGDRNRLDYAMDIINPFSYIDQARQVKEDINQGNLLSAGVGALGLIPGEGAIERGSGKFIHNKKGVSLKDLEGTINYHLGEGLGIKKGSENLTVKIRPGDLYPEIHVAETAPKFTIDLYNEGRPSGFIGLDKLRTGEYNIPGKKGTIYTKTADYPYQFSRRGEDALKGSGISGEFNKALTNALRDHELGRLYSSTRHTDEGLARWKNLVKKGKAIEVAPNRFKLLQNGGEMKFYQEGLDWKPRNISKQGSKIKKDDMGYWNPENWGEPVEISSPYITMEGVYEPLLGISDTGDVQMMYPGEDYEFDGETVTEYPVMQKGGTVPLYVSDANDPRLKTYQDSLYSYNVGQRMAGVLANDKNLIKVIPKSIIYKNLQASLKKHGNKLLDNSSIEARGYKNYEKIAEIMKEYQSKGNKGILPIKYQPYYPNPDNMVQDLITLRGVLDAIGITNPRPPGQANLPEWKKPEQQVVLDPSKAPKKSKVDKEYLKRYDNDKTNKPIYVSNPNDPRLKAYQDSVAKWNIVEKEHIQQTGKPFSPDVTIDWKEGRGDTFKPLQPVKYKKPESKPSVKPKPKKEQSKVEQPIKKTEQPKPVERKQNIYEGSPVYSPGAGSGLPSTLIGFVNQKGDTTYIKPEDYERFAVPKYGKEYIESKTASKKKNGGWLDKYK